MPPSLAMANADMEPTVGDEGLLDSSLDLLRPEVLVDGLEPHDPRCDHGDADRRAGPLRRRRLKCPRLVRIADLSATEVAATLRRLESSPRLTPSDAG
jgi:hypothetical protein